MDRRSTIGCLPYLTDKRHVAGLRAFLAFHDFEGDPLTLFESAEAVGVNGREVDENVALAGVGLDETVALFGVEPFDRAFLQKVYLPSCSAALVESIPHRSCSSLEQRPSEPSST